MRHVRDARLRRLHVLTGYLPHGLLHAHALQAQLSAQVHRWPWAQRQADSVWFLVVVM